MMMMMMIIIIIIIIIITDTLLENEYTFMITSRSFILRMRNVSDKSCRENQNNSCSNFFSRELCRL
jgi:uncharacterized membrane protein affecting hemolysin expression